MLVCGYDTNEFICEHVDIIYKCIYVIEFSFLINFMPLPACMKGLGKHYL